MTGWTEFALAFAAFVLSHLVPVRPAIRRQLVDRLGGRGFTLAYSALSVGMLGWVIVATGRAPYVELWPFASWQLWVPNLVMPFAVMLITLAIAAPNPLSFGGARNGDFDLSKPGVVGLSRHPLLLALAMWSAAHLVPNGNLAHVILFGFLAGFSVAGMQIIDRRKQRQMGAVWFNLAANTGWFRPHRLIDALRPPSSGGMKNRLLLAACAYAAILLLHPLLVGVSPLPP